MLPIFKILTPKVLKAIMKYVFEENDLDVQVKKLESRVNLLQELILETQSDVVVLQKTKTDKRKRKR